MSDTVIARLSAEPISISDCIEFVTDPTCGGIAVFIGTVRDHNHGRSVSSLDYEAHPSALANLAELARQAQSNAGVTRLAVVHRIGHLLVGDVAVVVAVSGPHRAQSLETCHQLIDRLKDDMPIWKSEHYADGSSEWVNCP